MRTGIRFDVFRRDNFTCQYCGRKPPEVELEVDHVIPRALGGSNDISNLKTACRECNRGKGKKPLNGQQLQ
ncbi:MAG: HNH endonuclease [Candidatus Marsarchaeota archaeon]|nr:HNH endonuclease [Candidatus Marsarchaeota archaeon]